MVKNREINGTEEIALVTPTPGQQQPRYWPGLTGVGVTKPIFPAPLFSEFFSIVETCVSYWISYLYLTGVAAAQLQWHLSNINVIQIGLRSTFARSKILLMEKLNNGALVTPTPGMV